MIEIKGKKEEVDTAVKLMEAADCKKHDDVSCNNCPLRDGYCMASKVIRVYTDVEAEADMTLAEWLRLFEENGVRVVLESGRITGTEVL